MADAIGVLLLMVILGKGAMSRLQKRIWPPDKPPLGVLAAGARYTAYPVVQAKLKTLVGQVVSAAS